MGAVFTVGETKKRPGVFQRYENYGTTPVAGAMNGIVATTFKGNWGEQGKVYEMADTSEIDTKIGHEGTSSIIKELLNTGASKVYAIRLGSGGTKGTVNLSDNADTSAVTLTAKCEGTRAFSYSLKPSLSDAGSKEFILYEGTAIKEKFVFASGAGEADRLIKAAAASSYFVASMYADYTGTGILKDVATVTAITPGTDPSTVSNADYSDAFNALEPYKFNTICIDSVEPAVHLLLTAFVDRMFNTGKSCFAVVGEPLSVAFDTRKQHAKAFNSYRVVYVGNGYKTSAGMLVDGYHAAAVVAALVAKTPSSQSVTHISLPGAVELPEMLTNTQYDSCIDSGMLVFSLADTGVIWIDSGITTLSTPSGEDDDGWKKIKRTKIRFELMQRTGDSVAPLIGKIPNNSDGQTNVIEVTQKVLDTMIAETKLLPGALVELDKVNKPVGDSAWYIITADDVDAIEKIYQTFRFRFAG